jgi:tetratricopeptide (TPR) repeat protein
MRFPALLPALAATLLLATPVPATPPSSVSPAASAHLAVGLFDEAAGDLEQLARDAAPAPVAAEALAEAAVLRLRLGERDRAAADAALLEQGFAETRPELIARVTLTRARDLAEREAWSDLRDLLAHAMPAFRRPWQPEESAEAFALLGRALARLDRPAEAAEEYRHALARACCVAPGSRGADGVGEARFFFAEQERAKVTRIVLPPYAGAGDRESINAYLLGPAQRWMEQKRYALEVAEVAYLRVFGVERPPPDPPRPPAPPPMGMLSGGDPNAPTAPWGRDDAELETSRFESPPSPRWAIAAAARVAMDWSDFAREFYALPVPPPWRDYQHLMTILDPPSDVWKQRSKSACLLVLRLSGAYHVDGEPVRACAQWLAKNHGAEFHDLWEYLPRVFEPLRPRGEPARL